MKRFLSLAICLMLSCQTPTKGTEKAGSSTITDQEATVETHVVSRGRYQYLLVVKDGPHAGKYLPEEALPSAYCKDELPVKIDGQLLDKKGMVYKPGPTDIPEENFEVPLIRVKAISGMKEN